MEADRKVDPLRCSWKTTTVQFWLFRLLAPIGHSDCIPRGRVVCHDADLGTRIVRSEVSKDALRGVDGTLTGVNPRHYSGARMSRLYSGSTRDSFPDSFDGAGANANSAIKGRSRSRLCVTGGAYQGCSRGSGKLGVRTP